MAKEKAGTFIDKQIQTTQEFDNYSDKIPISVTYRKININRYSYKKAYDYLEKLENTSYEWRKNAYSTVKGYIEILSNSQALPIVLLR